MTEWQIQSRSKACRHCEQGFDDGAVCHTLLIAEGAGHERQDWCRSCWDARDSGENGNPEGFISHWQGVYRAPPPPEPEAIQKNTAEDLLREIIERNDPQYRAAAYILSAMLERKRILKVKERVTKDGAVVFFYEHAKTSEAFVVEDPGLKLQELTAVQDQVALLLESGLATVGEGPDGEGANEEGANEEEGSGSAEGVLREGEEEGAAGEGPDGESAASGDGDRDECDRQEGGAG